ncbi:TetR/AcrR family transcriptional regulator [Oceanobacillus kapialis]|uniref:TetR/AcrR family transcriptional regulator n=1 Tax=Oceanobacillus kapialis TaxID=481353 RepID=UPI00384C0709
MSKSTQERIISATIELVKENGYKGATTKAIAEKAGVNEVTLFRHFGSKKKIVEAAIQTYSSIDVISDAIKYKVVWDLQKDLCMLAGEYQRLLDSKKDVILISLKEAKSFPELDKLISRLPIAYKEELMNYFSAMVEKGKLRNIDMDVSATNFLFLNFGYFMLKARLSPEEGDMPTDEFIEKHITAFVSTLR